MASVPQNAPPDPSKYDVFQQTFGISLCSNLAIGLNGTTTYIQKVLTDALPAALKKVGNGWEVVWGPVVWKADPDDPLTSYGNVWLVAKNDNVVFDDGTTRCAYVVAIAATSGIYDWIREDGAIGDVIDIGAWAKQGPMAIATAPTSISNNAQVPRGEPLVADGFGQSIYQLLNNAPPEHYTGYPRKLPEFLKSIQPDPSLPHPPKLVFTGHSLGGALSPVLAYALLKADCLGPFSKDLNDVHVYPTAGPSPGDATFAKEFAQYFPQRTSSPDIAYKHWNTNIVNQLDIVPCAYCMDSAYKPEVLDSIVPMYGDDIPLFQIPGVMLAVELLKHEANELYVPIAFKSFDSPIPKPSVSPDSTSEFIKTAHIYHVNSYVKEILGLDELPEQIHLEDEMDDWVSHPLLGFMAAKQKEVEANNGELPEGIAGSKETASKA